MARLTYFVTDGLSFFEPLYDFVNNIVLLLAAYFWIFYGDEALMIPGQAIWLQRLKTWLSWVNSN